MTLTPAQLHALREVAKNPRFRIPPPTRIALRGRGLIRAIGPRLVGGKSRIRLPSRSHELTDFGREALRMADACHR